MVPLIYQRLQSAAMLADELIEVHERPRQVARFTERYPSLTPEEGYGAALALHRHRLGRGWRPVGRKIGFTNRTIWPRYGVYEPIWGTVYDRTLVTARDGRAEISLAGLVQPRIEPEICFGMKSVPRSAEPGSLLDSIDWIAHSIEIVQCHHPAWKLALADCTTDNGLHGRLAVGEPMSLTQIPDPEATLSRFEVRLKKGAAEIDRGSGSNVLGSPLLALGHLVVILEKSGAEPLGAGEIVSTGTLTDAYPVAAGETWSTQFVGLPLQGLEVTFA
jgi:2-oxo-3-hexenedioate decarboxylase